MARKEIVLLVILLVGCQVNMKSEPGKPGKDGEVGESGVAGEVGAVGQTGAKGYDGATGQQGIQGRPGPQGQQGSQGQQGVPGEDGEDAIVEVIDPCGDSPGVDEVLLRLADGRIAAWYFGVGLFILEPGTYTTTDSQQCVFEVTADGHVAD